jgi:hypothetical protein
LENPLQQVLQGKDKSKVEQGKGRAQAAIDQCAIDDDINVPQSMAQNSNTNADGRIGLEQFCSCLRLAIVRESVTNFQGNVVACSL